MPRDGVASTVLGRASAGIVAVDLDASGTETGRAELGSGDIADWVARHEADHSPRWVWSDTPGWYRTVLDAGVRVARCHELRSTHIVLEGSMLARSGGYDPGDASWGRALPATHAGDTLFEVDDPSGPPTGIQSALTAYARQRAAIARSTDPGRLRLLTAAESAGTLVAVEMTAAGVPWDAEHHDRILSETLGARPTAGALPTRMRDAADRVREALGDGAVSLDSAPKLVRALNRAGVFVDTTSRWELAEHDHPVIAPLLAYKRMSRLLTANGWNWLDHWVSDGRFRPLYVPAGVVTGRWASSGGGALQIPRQLRSAVRADAGWTFVLADVAQLEPRALAAMSRDEALADAARGTDLYSGVVVRGAASTRADAKVAMLGAMYGATTGEAGRLVVPLRRTFPVAMRLVDDAARVGEDGGVVTTWLGRSSPPPDDRWRHLQARASEQGASASDVERARRAARDQGRFTRNFIVQGTAAEWAAVWLAEIRRRLDAMADADLTSEATASGRAFARRPHLAFFLHDEVIVHTPESQAEQVAEIVRESAAAATEALFGDFPLDFPLDLKIARSAEKS
ncbi:bifunctional 3'-5' exonuclease/DNA polymerase [Microbacterium koreense]|uniref:DNA-directed DNA polymerase n=1 Tax=Microbacterium koreense TaxID=323761 RepID=A0ABW2ZS68_9MICO